VARREQVSQALDEQLCFAVYAASRAITARYRPLLDELGLTYPQYLVLLVLWEGGAPQTVRDLGARLRLDSGTLSPLLGRLEGAGLVERRRRADDERSVHVLLTAAGTALQERALEVPCRMGAAMALDPAELGRLRDELTALATRLDTQ